MRTRQSLTVAVVAFVVIVMGVVVSLLAGGRPRAHRDEPGAATSIAAPAPPHPGTTAAHRHDTRTGRKNTTAVSASRAGPTPSGSSARRPPTFVRANPPAANTYQLSADGRAFTAVYGSLESGTEIGRLSRTQTVTVPVTGDAGDTTLVLTVQGYVLTGDGTTATLTVTVNDATSIRTYRARTDRSFTESLDVPMRGVHSCRITVRAQVDGAEGYLNASTLDGELR
jgi:hypothetical protein